MKLKSILKDLEILEIKGNIDLDKEISNICYNSKNISKDDIFVAIKGYKTDGHIYIKDAVEKGAYICVVEDFVDFDIIQIKVKNSRSALSKISANFYNNPSKDLNVIGITATNGKTTTSFMLKSIYEQASFKVGIIGTVYVKIDDFMIPSYLTTPESLDLQKYLSIFKEKKADRVVMEVSSAALDLDRAKDVDYNIVSFHNLSKEHMEQHGSYEAYKKAKSKLITERNENQIAILNFDNPELKELSKKTKVKVYSISLKNNDTNFSMENLDLSTGRGKFDFVVNKDIKTKTSIIKKQKFHIELNTAGYSSVMNAMVAIAIALLDNIDISIIQKALKSFEGVERRFQIVFEKDYKIIDDHFANEVNIDVTVQTLCKMKYNNLQFLYAIRGNRGVELNFENAMKIVKWKDKLNLKHIYATLSKDVVTWKDEVSEAEKEIFLKVMKENNIEVTLFDTLESAVKHVIDIAKKGDIVTFFGCQGMDKATRIALNYIVEKNPQYNKEEILLPLKNRIV